MAEPAIELTGSSESVSRLRQEDAQDDFGGTRHEFSLPPVDRGKDAWLFLTACFLIEALVWGKLAGSACTVFMADFGRLC